MSTESDTHNSGATPDGQLPVKPLTCDDIVIGAWYHSFEGGKKSPSPFKALKTQKARPHGWPSKDSVLLQTNYAWADTAWYHCSKLALHRMPSTESETGFVVGQRVIAVRTIDEGPSEESPGQTFCRKGEELIVRRLNDCGNWSIYVSHPHRTDSSFGVAPCDIIPFTNQPIMRDTLWGDWMEALKNIFVGQLVEVHVLPQSEDKRMLTPVIYSDGRGEKKIGRMYAINVCIEFEDGTFCFVHPSAIMTNQSPNHANTINCRVLDEMNAQPVETK